MHRVSGNSISFGQMKESIIKELLLISYRCIKYFILQIIFMIFLSFFLKCFLYFFGGWGGGGVEGGRGCNVHAFLL